MYSFSVRNIVYVFCISDGGEGSEEAAGEENGEVYCLLFVHIS